MDYGTIDTDYAGSLASRPADEDGPIWMVNFMRYRERADYRGDGPAISGRDADDRYAPTEVLAAIGAEVAYFGDVVDGGGGPDAWDRMAVVRYPTRRSFIDMQSRADFAAKRVHKDAGMEFTIILCALPAGPVRGAPDGSGIVRFVAYPAGVAPPPPGDGAVFTVEGTIVGDRRRWGHLSVRWSDVGAGALPEGAMSVSSRPAIDRMAPLIAEVTSA